MGINGLPTKAHHTTTDVAYNWIHAGFITYIDTLYVELRTTEKSYYCAYLYSKQDFIHNDITLIGGSIITGKRVVETFIIKAQL
ncbi:MAG: hypothetical protein ABI045_02025 [Flavobacteriales bacterium]